MSSVSIRETHILEELGLLIVEHQLKDSQKSSDVKSLPILSANQINTIRKEYINLQALYATLNTNNPRKNFLVGY